MGKKIVLRESQLKRLLQYSAKQKLQESLEDLEPVDYNMGKDDENNLPNPSQELNVDVIDGKFVDYTMGKEDDENQLPNPPQEINLDIEEDVPMDAEIDMETGITMEDDYSLNEGQKELKSTFNKYMGDPIIESLSSKLK
jgi:hypothetical protein